MAVEKILNELQACLDDSALASDLNALTTIVRMGIKPYIASRVDNPYARPELARKLAAYAKNNDDFWAYVLQPQFYNSLCDPKTNNPRLRALLLIVSERNPDCFDELRERLNRERDGFILPDGCDRELWKATIDSVEKQRKTELPIDQELFEEMISALREHESGDLEVTEKFLSKFTDSEGEVAIVSAKAEQICKKSTKDYDCANKVIRFLLESEPNSTASIILLLLLSIPFIRRLIVGFFQTKVGGSGTIQSDLEKKLSHSLFRKMAARSGVIEEKIDNVATLHVSRGALAG